MDIHGKNVVLTGNFLDFTRAEAAKRLTGMGAQVKGSVSAKTDLVFAGAKAGSKAEKAIALGVPVHDEAALAALMAGETVGETETEPETAGFPVLATEVTAADAHKLLLDADWNAFDTEADLPGLRDALSALEQREGITDAHRLATARLRKRGAVLRHPDGHQDELSSHALSPDGRYLAVGSWSGDDYERGGTIQVWEVATGRCVNILDGIFGGQGWPEYRHTLQWSADGRVLAGEFSISTVGKWDPFGDRVHPPLATVGVTAISGANRPVGFALHPDGSRVFVHHGDWDVSPGNGVWGCLAPLRRCYWGGRHGHEPDPVWMSKPNAKLFASLHGAAISPHMSRFSADGSRIWGFGEWIEPHDGGPIDWAEFQSTRECGVFAIDVKTRKLSWFVDTAFNRLNDYDRMAVSPDETLIVLNHGRRLVFLDAATGEQVAEEEISYDTPQLIWGAGNRLAVIDAEDSHGVEIFDGTALRCYLPLQPKPAHHDFPDGFAWAWSPDGQRAACLTVGDQVEIVDLYGEPTSTDGIDTEVLEAPVDAHGVWWGADDVLIIGGATSLRFIDLKTDTVIGDFRFGREVPQLRPLWNEHEDLGQRFRPNPTFALDDDRWAVALPEGVVIAPDTEQSTLDDHLAWAVDHRHAWPYRWGEARLAPHVKSCFNTMTGDSRKILAPLRNQAAKSVAAEWPPHETGAVEDLYAALDAALADFDGDSRWDFAVAQVRRLAARQRARTGQADAAKHLIRKIPGSEERDHTRALAEVALILAVGGESTIAGQLHREAVEQATSGMDDHGVPFIASAIGAGYVALGKPSQGEEWIERAIAAIDPEPNPWEHRLSVSWALLEAGLEDRARGLWNVDEPGSPFHSAGWLAHLVRIGRDDLVREFVYGRRTAWYDYSDVHAVFIATGRADLLREYCERHDRSIGEYDREQLAEAERSAVANRPTETDIAELRERHAALLRTPISNRREDTKRLAWRAAACGHYGAVLDLLPLLPDQEHDFRPDTAERALWIALTGVDDDPW